MKKYFLEQTIYYKKQIESRKEIMPISYTYPRVDVITNALQRQTYTQTVDDTLVLFAPFKASMGPMDEIIRIHSLGEFEETYGAITYPEWGQTGLNIRNWLENGGTVYAMRHDLSVIENRYNGNNISSTNHPAYAPYGMCVGGRYAISLDLNEVNSIVKELMGGKNASTEDISFVTSNLANINDLSFMLTQPEVTTVITGGSLRITGTLPKADHRFSEANFSLHISHDENAPVFKVEITKNNAAVATYGANGTQNVIDNGTLNYALIKNLQFLSFIDISNNKKIISSSAMSEVALNEAFRMTNFAANDDYRQILLDTENTYNNFAERATFYIGTEFGSSDFGRSTFYRSTLITGTSDNNTVYAKRVRPCSKLAGEAYKNLQVQSKVSRIDATGSATEYTVSVYNGASLVERFNVTRANAVELFDKDNNLSEYIFLGQYGNDASGLTFGVELNEYFRTTENAFVALNDMALASSLTSGKHTLTRGGGNGTATEAVVVSDVYSNVEGSWMNQIMNTLEFPIDFVLDAGYPIETKKSMYRAFCSENTDPGFLRNDIMVILDLYELSVSGKPENKEVEINSLIETSNTRNLATYSQYCRVPNPFRPAEQITVTPTYYLSQLIPFNVVAQQRGPHEPVAGLNRAVLNGLISVNESPLPDRKEEYFQNRINYIETDRYRSAFMSQRTRERRADNTALQFLNNSLTTNRMVKELSKLARVYLFEYNDAVTLSNLRNVLNKYIANFVENRTLSYAVVDVQKNPYSEEAIDVTLNIKFTGTIEVISVALTIE
jgi:hypothetical protein